MDVGPPSAYFPVRRAKASVRRDGVLRFRDRRTRSDGLDLAETVGTGAPGLAALDRTGDAENGVCRPVVTTKCRDMVGYLVKTAGSTLPSLLAPRGRPIEECPRLAA